ncbi:hypothetical protein Ahy_A10g047037 [Arachis hypogaea]|uniref:Serpin domain-containing protein n=1 Tax=Arachis hypogaea TaxID=3818 RepID=A0A445B1B4_ARAHY|nr:hypothetical protein Ahy_A10g047037 [Arachis hypogaea]
MLANQEGSCKSLTTLQRKRRLQERCLFAFVHQTPSWHCCRRVQRSGLRRTPLVPLQSESINDLNSVATQLLSSVLVDCSSSGGPLHSYVNGVWVDKSLSLKPSFSQILENTYKSTLISLDFTNNGEIAK